MDAVCGIVTASGFHGNKEDKGENSKDAQILFQRGA
jgi:hypothetical protein